MILIYKKIKKRNERKRLDSAVSNTPDNAIELDTVDIPQPDRKQKTRSPEEVAEKRRNVYRWKIILGLFSPYCLQALDTTIIASALPFIAEDFNQIKQLNWIISVFNLTSAAFLFFWAQLTDLFGRHIVLQSAIFVMLIGSAICTGAPTSAFSVLLVGRALQGVGAAGVNISIRTILADRVSLTEYAVNWTIFALVSGIGFSIGPVIGGYLTQASWRWCFAINLPIAVVAMIIVVLVLRTELQGPQPIPELEERIGLTPSGRFFTRISTIDYGGQMLFLWGFGLLILALTWAGGTYSWKSAAVLAPMVIGGILVIAWVIYERCMLPGSLMARILPRQKAMMPWELLRQRDIGLLFLINVSIGIAMFAVMYFMDIYFTLVEGRSSSDAGVALLYFLPGLAAGLYMAMFSSNVWPRQTFPALFMGSITSAVGMTVLAWGVNAGKTSVIYGMMALVGHGVGMRMNPASMHGLAYFPAMTAQILCLASFAVPFGGLLGLTIMSTVFTNKSGAGEKDAKGGIMWAFIAMLPFMWLSVLFTTFLGNVWILKKGGHEVINKSYFWGLIFRREIVRERRDRGEELEGAETRSAEITV
ncbi:Major facilitator superfamily domain general substrate transporter [Penicillium coprophilum]|uniref:Major facilitator superfamily domain general substrate transporter n=1 Tax=Penicillium coprophilum TaxID=36646 RepID=UPI002394D13D|nr:Major facilitator superfamily domain general substrate transporter [Penicillium coprophilum]KAJ5170802.1 Major facilitator superfamily domain general substrate transporter [Penicillium coprophilum]